MDIYIPSAFGSSTGLTNGVVHRHEDAVQVNGVDAASPELYPGARLPEEAPDNMETALVVNISSGVREPDDAWCHIMADHVREARTKRYFVHFVLFPLDIHEASLVEDLTRIMRSQRAGWDMVVLAMRGRVFEEFHAINELFNTCIRKNAKVPVLLFQYDTYEDYLSLTLQRVADFQ